MAARAAAVWQARTLLRAAKAGTLATAVDGQPFAALVTPAAAPDLSVLMLLSSLSEHTRQLKQDGRCALMVTGDAADANPQTAPRLTVTGTAAVIDDPALKARWVARHPYAAFYAEFTDFSLFHLVPGGGQFIGGFASAHRLAADDLQPDAAAVAAVLESEPGILSHVNADHADALARIAGSPGWHMTACDVDGFDLLQGEDTVRRFAWSAPVADAGGVRQELVRMARPSRGDGGG